MVKQLRYKRIRVNPIKMILEEIQKNLLIHNCRKLKKLMISIKRKNRTLKDKFKAKFNRHPQEPA